MNTLVIAEHDQKELSKATLCTINAAAQLTNDIIVLVAGYQCDAVVQEARAIQGVSNVLVIDAPLWEHPMAETMAALIVANKGDATYLLAPATTFGKNIMPRVAALLEVTQISDITAVVDKQTFLRPIYAGNAIATVRVLDNIKIITVRATAFAPALKTDGQLASQATITFTPEQTLAEFVKIEQPVADRPVLSSAEIVISGGRGLQDQATFDRLAAIALRMGAALGASRAAVDAGLAPNDCQVGQTGQIVAPKLYIAVGISGAIQHLAGMKDSKIIVAINKDPEAPIFQIADYGLVADLTEVLPQWEAKLEEMGY